MTGYEPAILTALGSVVVTAGTIYGARRAGKTAGHAADLTAATERYAALLDGLQSQVTRLETRLDAAESEIDGLKSANAEKDVTILRWRTRWDDLVARWDYHRAQPSPPTHE